MKTLSFSGIFAIFCLAGTLSAQSLFPNPDFETINPKTGFADKWLFAAGQGGKTLVTSTSENCSSGKHAIKMEIKDVSKRKLAIIWGGHYFRPAVKETMKIKISFRAAGEIKSGTFYPVLTMNAKRPSARQYHVFEYDRESFPWKTIEKEFVVYPGTDSLTLSFRADGTGTYWFDNVQASVLKDALLIRKPFSDPVQADGLPAGWTEKKYDGNENVSEVKIEKVPDGPAFITAARQQWKSGGEKSGFAFEVPQELLGKAIQITSRVKCKDAGRAAVGFELLNDAGSPIKESLGKPSNLGEWSRITHSIVLPQKGKVRILLLNTGRGTVWFDGVTIVEDKTGKAAKLAPDALSCHMVPVDTSRERFGNCEFNTFADSPTAMAIYFSGIKSKLKNPAVCIDLPEEVRIGDAWFPHPGAIKTPSEKAVVTPLTRKEGRYRRWKFVYPRGMKDMKPTKAYMRAMALVFMPADPKKVKKSSKVYWHYENDGTEGPEESFTLNFLPPMEKLPNPKHFQFMRWESESLYIHNRECLIASLKHLEECGYIWRQFKFPGEINDIFKARKVKWPFYTIDGRGNNFVHFPKYLKIDGAARDLAGKKMPWVCPELYINDPTVRKAYEQEYLAQIKRDGLEPGDYFFMDNEDFSPMRWCFCERCRKAFAKKYGIDGVPDGKTILSKYGEKWRDFRCEHGFKTIELVRDVLRKNLPGAKLSDYDYHFDFTKPDWRRELYGVAKDPVLNESLLDMHIVSYYHEHDAKMFDRIKSGRQTLKKPYVPMCAIDSVCYYQTKADLLTPAQFRLEMLSAGALGCRGFAIFPGNWIDGKIFVAANQAMAEIAALEDYFLKGKPASDISVRALPYRSVKVQVQGKETEIESPRWSQSFRSVIRTLDKKTAVVVLNFDPAENLFAEVKLDKPLGKRKVLDHAQKKIYPLSADTQSFLVHTGPREACLLEISEDIGSAPLAPDQQEMQKQFENHKAEYLRKNSSGMSFQPVKSGNLELAYGDANQDGELDAVLSNKNHTLFLDLSRGGNPIDWKFNGLSMRAEGNSFAQLMFWGPASIRRDSSSAKPVRIVDAGIRNGKVFVTAERKMSEAPILVRQTYSIAENAEGFEVRIELQNQGKNAMTLIPRLHNVFNPGDAPNMLDGCTVDYMSDGKFIRLERTKSDGFLPVPGGQLTADIKRSCYPVTSNGDKIRQYFLKPKLGIEAKAELSKLMCYFVYSGLKTATIEWIYNPVTLKPDGKVDFSAVFSTYR